MGKILARSLCGKKLPFFSNFIYFPTSFRCWGMSDISNKLIFDPVPCQGYIFKNIGRYKTHFPQKNRFCREGLLVDRQITDISCSFPLLQKTGTFLAQSKRDVS